jgi:hypothetical protein
MVTTVLAWQTHVEWWNTLGHSLGAFATSPGLGGVAAVIAAVIAWLAVRRTSKTEGRRHRREERLEAAIGAVEALEEANFNVRQRELIVYRPDPRADTDMTPTGREKWTNRAAARHYKVPAAIARVHAVGMEDALFREAQEAVNKYSNYSYAHAKDKPADQKYGGKYPVERQDVKEADEAARKAIDAVSKQLPDLVRIKRRARRWR